MSTFFSSMYTGRNINVNICIFRVNRIANESLFDILTHYKKFLNRLESTDDTSQQLGNVYDVIPRKDRAGFNYMYDGNSAEWHHFNKEDAIDPVFSTYLKNHNYHHRGPTERIAKNKQKLSEEPSSFSTTVYAGHKVESGFKPSILDVTGKIVRTSPIVRVVTARPLQRTPSHRDSLRPVTSTGSNWSRKTVASANRPRFYRQRTSEGEIEMSYSQSVPDRSATKPMNPLINEQIQYQRDYMKRYGFPNKKQPITDFPYKFYKAN